MNLVTYEDESPAKLRDAYIGNAWVGVYDEDAPKVLKLTPPGWSTGASATIGYELEDTGLGVRSASVRQTGETAFQTGGGADFACTGTTASPCPRKPVSTEAGLPKLTFVPSAMPTGVDNLEVVVADPLAPAAGHTATLATPVKIDHTPPEIVLSGPLTEQEQLGRTLAEYPLEIAVKDGTEDVAQSGVKSVEVKVDGKKVTMANETPWHPNCSTQNCPFSGSWTMKASEYAPGAHEVEVVATDALGQVSATVQEVELGLEPLQTSFTSPHPSYLANELSTVAFKATQGRQTGRRGDLQMFAGRSRGRRSGREILHLALTGCPVTSTTAAHFHRRRQTNPAKRIRPPATMEVRQRRLPAGARPPEKLVFPEVGKKTAS